MTHCIHLYLTEAQIAFIRRRGGCVSATVRALLNGAYYAGELGNIVELTEPAATEHVELLMRGAKHNGKANR